MSESRTLAGKVNVWNDHDRRYYPGRSSMTVEVRHRDSIYIDGKYTYFHVYHGRNGRWFVVKVDELGWAEPANGLDNLPYSGAEYAIFAAVDWAQQGINERGGWLEDPIEPEDRDAAAQAAADFRDRRSREFWENAQAREAERYRHTAPRRRGKS